MIDQSEGEDVSFAIWYKDKKHGEENDVDTSEMMDVFQNVFIYCEWDRCEE